MAETCPNCGKIVPYTIDIEVADKKLTCCTHCIKDIKAHFKALMAAREDNMSRPDADGYMRLQNAAQEFKNAVQTIARRLDKAHSGYEHLHVDAGGLLQDAIDKFEGAIK